ncbi:MAG: HAD family hydrolase [Candidatus Fermentibacteraceae bacterium]
MERKYETVIFDLDGTLLDYASAQREAVSATAAEMELHVPEEKLLELVDSDEVQALEACRPGAPGKDSPGMENAFRRCGVEADPAEFLNRYYGHLSMHHGTVEGALETLRKLKETGISIGLVSNGPGEVQRPRIRESGIIEYLDAIVLSCEAGMAKPDPEILGLAMRLLEASPQTTLFAGDSTSSDLPAAEAAGVDFVLLSPDGGFPDEGRRVLDATSLPQVRDLVLGS